MKKKLLDCVPIVNGELIIPSEIDGESVTCIEYDAFRGCKRLKSITIPDSVTSIENGAFSDCTGLTSIIIPDSVKSIGLYAFSRCTRLKSIIIPDSVKSIGRGAFSDCTGLKSITIPDSVTDLGIYFDTDLDYYYPWNGCDKLEKLSVPAKFRSQMENFEKKHPDVLVYYTE